MLIFIRLLLGSCRLFSLVILSYEIELDKLFLLGLDDPLPVGLVESFGHLLLIGLEFKSNVACTLWFIFLSYITE